MTTAAFDSCGSRSFRMSKIVLIDRYPPSPPGVRNGAGSCGPGPGGGAGAGANGQVGGGGRPGGSKLSRRAPGGAFGGSGTGVPGTFGAGATGQPGIGYPGCRR